MEKKWNFGGDVWEETEPKKGKNRKTYTWTVRKVLETWSTTRYSTQTIKLTVAVQVC